MGTKQTIVMKILLILALLLAYFGGRLLFESIKDDWKYAIWPEKAGFVGIAISLFYLIIHILIVLL